MFLKESRNKNLCGCQKEIPASAEKSICCRKNQHLSDKFTEGRYALFLMSKAFFSTQPQCCFTFSWIEFQMLLRCCLIHKSIIMLRPLHLLFIFIRPTSIYIYVIYFSFSFLFWLWLIIKSYKYKHSCSLIYFLGHALLFLDNSVDEDCE